MDSSDLNKKYFVHSHKKVLITALHSEIPRTIKLPYD